MKFVQHPHMLHIDQHPVYAVLLAASLFGATAPLAKLLLATTGPVMLAGLLYLGCGAGLALYMVIRTMTVPAQYHSEAPLTRPDIPWICGAVIAGGVCGPILLMIGLSYIPAATASLLLNCELVMTAGIAFIFFHEQKGKNLIAAIILIVIAGILLSFDPEGIMVLSLGALAVIAACFFWGLDNNLTTQIAAKDPLMIVFIKGIGAGCISFCIALGIGESIPSLALICYALFLGFFGYGLSIVFFIYALRGIGAARSGSIFATAPVIGTVFSFMLFPEMPDILFIFSFLLMIAAIWLILSEHHLHPHTHNSVTHEHRHLHPEKHHIHHHENVESTNSQIDHTHPHIHEQITHDHSHTPDIHHRHRHEK